jgi:hypothetical protein
MPCLVPRWGDISFHLAPEKGPGSGLLRVAENHAGGFWLVLPAVAP